MVDFKLSTVYKTACSQLSWACVGLLQHTSIALQRGETPGHGPGGELWLILLSFLRSDLTWEGVSRLILDYKRNIDKLKIVQGVEQETISSRKKATGKGEQLLGWESRRKIQGILVIVPKSLCACESWVWGRVSRTGKTISAHHKNFMIKLPKKRQGCWELQNASSRMNLWGNH